MVVAEQIRALTVQQTLQSHGGPGAIGFTAAKNVYLKRLFSLSQMLHSWSHFPERHLVLIFIHFQKFK